MRAYAGPDRRVKCVVACNPLIAGYEIVLSGAGSKSIQGFMEMVQQERGNLLEGKAPTLMALGRRADGLTCVPQGFSKVL